MNPEEIQVIQEIAKEAFGVAFRQFLRWGVQMHPLDRWVSIIAEETGEVARACNENAEPHLVRLELLQLAGACLCAVYEHDLARSAAPELVSGEIVNK